jgi:Nucleotidyl transferase AbiEii toxin, Type IV TA system
MRLATDEPMLRIDPGVPATDSQNSLDFDQIAFHTPNSDGQIAVEISYREAVVDKPEWADIGPPYYAEFQVPVLTLEETVAEKLRALLKRLRPTDLSDLALILRDHGGQLDRAHVRELAVAKFTLVKRATAKGATSPISRGCARATTRRSPDWPRTHHRSPRHAGWSSPRLPPSCRNACSIRHWPWTSNKVQLHLSEGIL